MSNIYKTFLVLAPLLVVGCSSVTTSQESKPKGFQRISLQEAQKFVLNDAAPDFKYKVSETSAKKQLALWANLNGLDFEWNLDHDYLLDSNFNPIRARELNQAIKQINGVFRILEENLKISITDTRLIVQDETGQSSVSGNVQATVLQKTNLYVIDKSHKSLLPLLLQWSKVSGKNFILNGVTVDKILPSHFDFPLPADAYRQSYVDLNTAVSGIDTSYASFKLIGSFKVSIKDDSIQVETTSLKSPPKVIAPVVVAVSKSIATAAEIVETMPPAKEVAAETPFFKTLESDNSVIAVLNRWAFQAGYKLIINKFPVGLNFPRHDADYVDLIYTPKSDGLINATTLNDAMKNLSIALAARIQTKAVDFTVDVNDDKKEISISSVFQATSEKTNTEYRVYALGHMQLCDMPEYANLSKCLHLNSNQPSMLAFK